MNGDPANRPNDAASIGPSSGLTYVHPTATMAAGMERLEREVFATIDPNDLFDATYYRAISIDFAIGTFVGFDGNDRSRPAALASGIRVDFDFDRPQHQLADLISAGPTRSGDDPDGRWYYGTDIAVSSEYRRRGIGRELYELRKQVCRRLGLAGIVAGGVIPGYAEHLGSMTADEYIAAVSAGELYDPTLSFQIDQGFEAECALADYVHDASVGNWAALIIWRC